MDVPNKPMFTNHIQTVSHTGDIEHALRKIGWEWCLEDDCTNYLPGEAVALPEPQADALLEAAGELYDMMVESVPDDLPDSFMQMLAIPENLWQVVRKSWHDDRHWHIYGRFDLAMTADGPKLLEFNADTATSIPETAVVQWASLAAAGKHEAQQLSGLYEALVEQFLELREQNSDLSPDLLLVYIGASQEDKTNCDVLAEAAKEAGFNTHTCPIDEMILSEKGGERGVWKEVESGEWQLFPFLFKLVPWEQIAWEEPELCEGLSNLVLTRNVVVINPAYTLLFQSKGMLAWLWMRYPNHPLLLETDFQPISGKSIRKPFFGREGQNITVAEDEVVQLQVEGEYSQQQFVHQRYCHLSQDKNGHQYQAGVFWAGEGCAIGFRRDKSIITNLSQFLPHLVV
ncbi:MAG: glutathionylspermidine synthase family protein [Hymenobacteraceae bacterium]|nr:glutathionylspermidine synthase family protein [Hymenobacteraceae bacterium]MDX5395676.1 glutathionylspermidine synthase family protein [Hymenobacteraceae bacterium]MDX5511729.1 glutathionylspermidine synthase family protein [Hymenobacteraceae bacterium]